MKITKDEKEFTISLDERELKLLRRALERASYIDTPVDEQEAILGFASRALDQLAGLK